MRHLATTAITLSRLMKQHARPDKALILQRFFKTGPGEYGEGDVFLGVSMPDLRRIAKLGLLLPDKEIFRLLKSSLHEERMLALLIWVEQFQRGDRKRQQQIASAYLKSVRWINQWDLIDVTAPYILGPRLLDQDVRMRAAMKQFIRSNNVWKRRIALLASFALIRNKQFETTLTFCQTVLRDEHPLIHKAAGWMLREIGKRNPKSLRAFLAQSAAVMPRTMLRYSVERLPLLERRKWMKQGGEKKLRTKAKRRQDVRQSEEATV